MSEASDTLKGISESRDKRSPLEESLHRLEFITLSLRLVGLCAAVLTLGCVLASFYNALALSRVMNNNYSYSPSYSGATYKTIFYFSIFLGGTALMSLLLYEFRRRQGDTLFEEISDELEWHIEVRSSGKTHDSAARPDLRARIALRSFARTTDLPLFPGRYGPAGYALLTILTLFAEIFIARGFL